MNVIQHWRRCQPFRCAEPLSKLADALRASRTARRLHEGYGDKPQMLIAADRWDDAEWLRGLLRIAEAELPAPKPRKAKAGV